MLLDRKLSKLFSDFFLDISKASFIALFITTPTTNYESVSDVFFILTKYILGAILFMYLAWIFKEK